MFVRRDARAPPLTRLYQGPYKVVKNGEKYFELEMRGKIDRVSIDCLKRAYLEDEIPDFSVKSTKTITNRSEVLTGANTEPLIPRKRGRPKKTWTNLATSNDQESPDIFTRSGRLSRPPDRL